MCIDCSDNQESHRYEANILAQWSPNWQFVTHRGEPPMGHFPIGEWPRNWRPDGATMGMKGHFNLMGGGVHADLQVGPRGSRLPLRVFLWLHKASIGDWSPLPEPTRYECTELLSLIRAHFWFSIKNQKWALVASWSSLQLQGDLQRGLQAPRTLLEDSTTSQIS